MPGSVLGDAETMESGFLRIYRKTLSVAYGSPNEGFLPYIKVSKCQMDFLRLSPKAETTQENKRRPDRIQT